MATTIGWYRQQMGAALLGLAAGLMIVVPAVLWMSGWFEPHKSKPGAMPHVAALLRPTSRPRRSAP